MHLFSPSSFDWMSGPSRRFAGHIFPINAGMETAWESQTPPRYPTALDTEDQRTALYCWWLIEGVSRQPSIPFVCTQEHLLLLKAPRRLSSGRLLPLWLYGYWLVDTQLQKTFDIHTDKGLAEYFVWWLLHARGKNGIRALLPLGIDETVFLEELEELPQLPLPRGLTALAALRPDIGGLFPCTTPENRAGLLCWWLLGGQRDFSFLPIGLTGSLIQPLLEASPGGIPLFTKGILAARPEIAAHFPLVTEAERANLHYWFFDQVSLQLRSTAFVRSLLASLLPGIALPQPVNGSVPELPDNACREAGAVFPPALEPEPHDGTHLFAEIAATITALQTGSKTFCLGETEHGGINIVGFAQGELGLGEDVRMAVQALDTTDAKFTVYDPPFTIASRKGDNRLAGRISPAPRYDVNLIFLPGIETLRLFFSNGAGLFKDRYNIGAWQWELPYWPKPLRMALPLAQEFWAASLFIADTMRTVAEVPVLHMPMAVALHDFPKPGRTAYGLPENEYLFLFVFDGLSWGARKNPMGVIKAFQDAFPRKQKKIRLVIKTMNATADMVFWKMVMAEAAGDSRIILINEIYTRDQVLGLFDCCDAYISLHRSEGFGRTIAEAMLMGKPVVATAWSGNADFTTEETAFPVTGKLIPIQEGEYLLWEGQHWCEPDHDQAVAALRACHEKPALAAERGLAARAFMQKNYSPFAVGERYIKRLQALGVCIPPSRKIEPSKLKDYSY